MLSCLLIAVFTATQRARAQAPEAPGIGRQALPGVSEIPLAAPLPDAVTARVGVGYGWTESVLKMQDTHQRMQLDAAASVRPTPWFATGLRLLGRYDAHNSPAGGADSGVVTETHVHARAVFPVGERVHAGGELELWLPAGNDVGDALSAVSGGLQLIAAYTAHPLTVGLTLGVQMDRSQYAGGEPRRFSAADRLALGASDDVWGTRQGIALSYAPGAVEWIAEWAYRMYFARPAQSPMWIRLGARVHPVAPLQLELLAGLSPSARPSLANAGTLAVVEPRFAVELSAVYAWSLAPPPSAASVIAPPVANEEPRPPAAVHGQVLARSGAALPGAIVTFRRGEDERAQAHADEQGHFSVPGLQAGEYALEVTAEGFAPTRQSLTLSAGAIEELRFELEPELPIGQIRGTVRRFDGKPVVATVAIAQLEIKEPCQPDGTFELNVPPGEYTVVVTAKGFAPQTRQAKVELRGVAILIVELESRR